MDFEGPVVGITGSCGKTSTKEILKVILGEEKTHSTFGNLNNHLGVPLTILSQDNSIHEFSVIEAGINQRDEMAALAKMIEPEYVIVTSIGNSHLEGLGSRGGEEDICRDSDIKKHGYGAKRDRKKQRLLCQLLL